jgi:hypothetical protein
MIVPYGASGDWTALVVIKEEHRESCEDVKFLSQRIARLRREEERVLKEQELQQAHNEKMEAARQERRRREAEKKQRSEEEEIQHALTRRRLQEEKDSQRHAVFVAKAKVVVDRRERCADVKREISRSLSLRREADDMSRDHTIRRHDEIRGFERSVSESRQNTPRRTQQKVTRDAEEEARRLQRERDENIREAARLVTEQAQILHRLRLLKPTETPEKRSESRSTPRKP